MIVNLVFNCKECGEEIGLTLHLLNGCDIVNIDILNFKEYKCPECGAVHAIGDLTEEIEVE